MSDDVILEVLDSSWNRKALSKELNSAEVTYELGDVGEGSVTINKGDSIIGHLPDPDAANPFEGRFRIYEGAVEQFAGVIDSLSYKIDAEGNQSFNGKGRGIELSYFNFGKREINGWPVRLLFRELLRKNIATAPIANIKSVTAQMKSRPAVNCITGDVFEGQYWSCNGFPGTQSFTIDLGGQKLVDAIRVIPPWWNRNLGWYKWKVYTSTDNVSFTQIYNKSVIDSTTDRGVLVGNTLPDTFRYVKIEVYDSEDGIARMASVLVYQNLTEIGTDTTYTTPFIENDDSGNIAYTGAHSRPPTNGAFNGDGLLGGSYVTQLSGTAAATHTFRGPSTSVYLTQADDGDASVQCFIDTVSQGTFTAHNGKFQEKVFEIEGLSAGVHTLKVQQVSGTPNIDYFTGQYETSWRWIKEDDPGVGYLGSGWAHRDDVTITPSLDEDWNFALMQTVQVDDQFSYEYYGDRIRIIGTKGPYNTSSVDVYVDGSLVTNIDCTNGTFIHKQLLYEWTGSYGAHEIRMYNRAVGTFELDRIEGNFNHAIYMRSAYNSNLSLLSKMSEILNGFMRYNLDGTVDLLGAVGEHQTAFVLREGENEGGSIVNATTTNDYSDTYSAVLALVNGNNNLPIKSFVVDREAVKVMGLKIGRLENSDSVDAFLLTRQAWVYLQDHKNPNPTHEIEYFTDDTINDGQVLPGNAIKLYAPSIDLDGVYKRIQTKKVSWEQSSSG